MSYLCSDINRITMYIQRNKSKSAKGKEYVSVLLCSKYREGGKIKTRVELNLSGLPEYIILGIENMLKSKDSTTVSVKDISVGSCIDCGFLFVLLEMLASLRIDEVLEKTLPSADAALAKAMIVGKIMTGGSKLCIYNWLNREPVFCDHLGVEMTGCKVDHLYGALGQLHRYQSKIETKWFRYHKGSQRRIYLYDITSSYLEGTQNEFADYGYNRDNKRGKMQICIGLMTSEDGFPLRIEAFSGNTSDSTTVADQILALKKELGVEQVVFVGDRGMQIMYNLENDPELSKEHVEFITGLTHIQINKQITNGVIEFNLFSRDLAEVDVDGMRYILSVNPELEVKELFWLNNSRERVDALVDNIRKSWSKRCALNMENRSKQQQDAKKSTNT